MNRLPGTIVAVERCGSIALVDVDAAGHRLTATLVGAGADTNAPGWMPGSPVLLLFAETEVALAKNLSGLISMRNRLRCRLAAIERGTVLTKVTLAVDGKTLVSVITTRSARSLSLEVGDAVEALVKANEMHVVPADVPADIPADVSADFRADHPADMPAEGDAAVQPAGQARARTPASLPAEPPARAMRSA